MRKPAVLIAMYIVIGTVAHSQEKTVDSVKQDSSAIKAPIQAYDSAALSATDTLSYNNTDRSLKIILVPAAAGSSIFKDILPFLTLILGIAINRVLDHLNSRRRTKKSGGQWMAELRLLAGPIQKQIEYLQKFKEEHEKPIFRVPDFHVLQSLNAEGFSSLDKAELIKYLELFKNHKEQRAIEAANRIAVFIGILRGHYNDLIEKFNEYKSETSTHTSNLTKSLQEFLQHFTFYMIALEKELGGDPTQDPRLAPMLQLVDSEIYPYMASGNYDIFELEKRFIAPMMVFTALHRTDERIIPIALSIRDMINHIKGIKMEKHYLSENITTITNRYGEEADELKEILNEIDVPKKSKP